MKLTGSLSFFGHIRSYSGLPFGGIQQVEYPYGKGR